MIWAMATLAVTGSSTSSHRILTEWQRRVCASHRRMPVLRWVPHRVPALWQDSIPGIPRCVETRSIGRRVSLFVTVKTVISALLVSILTTRNTSFCLRLWRATSTVQVCSVSGLAVTKVLYQLQTSVVLTISMATSVSSKHISTTQTSSMNIAESVAIVR